MRRRTPGAGPSRRPRARPALRRWRLHRPGLCLRPANRRDCRVIRLRHATQLDHQRRDRRRRRGLVHRFRSGAPVPGSDQRRRPVGDFTTLTVTGPAGDVAAGFNLNGIAATPDDSTLVVAHSNNAAIYTVDPATGASALLADALPNVDGILFEAGRIWAVQNFLNQITELRPSGDLVGQRRARDHGRRRRRSVPGPDDGRQVRQRARHGELELRHGRAAVQRGDRRALASARDHVPRRSIPRIPSNPLSKVRIWLTRDAASRPGERHPGRRWSAPRRPGDAPG